MTTQIERHNYDSHAPGYSQRIEDYAAHGASTRRHTPHPECG